MLSLLMLVRETGYMISKSDTVFEQHNNQLFRKFHIKSEWASALMLIKYFLQKTLNTELVYTS